MKTSIRGLISADETSERRVPWAVVGTTCFAGLVLAYGVVGSLAYGDTDPARWGTALEATRTLLLTLMGEHEASSAGAAFTLSFKLGAAVALAVSVGAAVAGARAGLARYRGARDAAGHARLERVHQQLRAIGGP